MPIRLALAVALLWVAGLSPTAAQQGHWQGAAGTVVAAVAEVEAAALRGETDAAKRAINDAYFKRFEDSKLEAAIRKEISAKRAAQIERLFAELRKVTAAGDKAGVSRIAAEIREAVSADAKTLDAAKVPAELFKVNQ